MMELVDKANLKFAVRKNVGVRIPFRAPLGKHMWTLTICTAAWLLCGTVTRIDYPNEESCYKAMDILYKQHGKEDFKYVTCSYKPMRKE